MGSVHVKQAVNIAEEVVRQHGFTTLPINPLLIAEQKGIYVKQAQLNGFAGCLIKQGDVFGILYSNSVQNKGFQNFTIAHELGHYFLDGHAQKLFPLGDGEHFSNAAFQSKDQIELEADRFAASLLMPEGLFKTAMSKITGHGMHAIETLQNLCETSMTATALRYSDLADFPSAVVMSIGKQIEFCICSPDMRDAVRERIYKGDTLPPDSNTYKFNLNSANIQNCEKIEESGYLSSWFPDAPSHEILEDVIGLGAYGRTLTFIFAPDGFSTQSNENE